MNNQITIINNNTETLSDSDHLVRQRVNMLLSNAKRNPIITVCAGAGCGKTYAVLDFLQRQSLPAFWIQLSERDNSTTRFWESYTSAVEHYSESIADEYRKLGFPDTEKKLERYTYIRNSALEKKPGFLVWDDFHLITAPAVLHFLERMTTALTNANSSAIIISREMPRINLTSFQVKGSVSEINETDLNFNEKELTEYFKQQDLLLNNHIIREVFQDTKGWPFAISLVARSLKKVPQYTGYVKNAFKKNIFNLMENDEWQIIPERIQHFIVCLSLLDHLSEALVNILADGDDELLSGLRQQNAYIRFDTYGATYIIHDLFLDFLKTKQSILTDKEKRETYKAAAEWCRQNNFKMDALNYYEKISDYDSIILILWELYEHATHDTLLYAAGIFERAPKKVFDSVPFFAACHLLVLTYLGRWQDFTALAETYEQKLLTLPEDNAFRNHTLGGIYYLWGNVRLLMCTFDNHYDFDVYYAKAGKCFDQSPTELIQKIVLPQGAWVSTLGSSKAGAPRKYTEAIDRSVKKIKPYYNGITGFDDLCSGELMFYQGDLRGAESLFHKVLEQEGNNRLFETKHRAFYYIIRIAIARGNQAQAEQALDGIAALLNEEEYSRRFNSHDIAIGLYYCILRQTDMVPDWLKSEFETYGHAHFYENFANQIKARYIYIKKNFQPLLSYIKKMKDRESILYGRVEMLAMEACIHYQMKNRGMAFETLKEAYKTAYPNNITMPFVELGKDMRTLARTALSDKYQGVPQKWLETVRNKAASYARNQSTFISEYEKNINNKLLSVRERDVLNDLYNGLTQPEIATARNISVNTVKMITKSLYEKLYVHKISDLIRVAAEQQLV